MRTMDTVCRSKSKSIYKIDIRTNAGIKVFCVYAMPSDSGRGKKVT